MAGKIIGNQNPVVGIQHPYEINTLASILMGGFSTPNSVYEWYLYKKQKNGTWKDITQTPKNGIKVSYNFGEISIGVEFRMKVYEVKSGLLPNMTPSKTLEATLDIVPSSSKIPQIEKVVLFKKSGGDVNQANYRDTLTAQAHCIAMFDQEVEFNLWEDDAAEGGHNPTINKNNRSPRIYKARVNEKGIAEVKIPLSSDEKILKQIANKYLMKGDKNEGKNHEYYVTASYHGKIQKASQVNVDVANPDYKKEQPKQQVPPSQQPTLPPKKPQPGKTTSQPQKPQPKQNTPKFPATKSSSAPRQADSQGRITDAYFVNAQSQRISQIVVGQEIQVQIRSSNMTGKNIQYVIWEYDASGHDEIYRSSKMVVKGDVVNTSAIKIDNLKFSKGYSTSATVFGKPMDGDSVVQSYFIEVIPLDVSAESKKFGLTDEKQRLEVLKSAAVVNAAKQEAVKKGECFCNRDFEEKDVRKLVKLLKGSETIWEGQALRGGKRAECDISDKSFVSLTKELNNVFKRYNINTCTRKMHFLAQVCEETGVFALSEETKSKYASSKSLYKGRGVIQLTGVKAKGSKLYDLPGPYQNYSDYTRDQNVVKNPSIVANNVHYCIDSGGWSWSANAKAPSFKESKKDLQSTKDKKKRLREKYKEILGKTPNEIADYVDKYQLEIGKVINGFHENTDPINQVTRKLYYTLLKDNFFEFRKYHENIVEKKKEKINDEIVNYHIFSDGNIEKHIPKKIKVGYENTYGYIYHDTKNKEHGICTAEWHITNEKANGEKPGKKPTHSKIIFDKYVHEGQTDRRIKYENGDIAEYGSNDGSSFWVLYRITGKKIELVKMPDSLNYSNDGVVIKYEFTKTQRRYTNPDYLAVFIGALADCGFVDVQTTGSCFEEASCFPSVEHVNGKSIDTIYLDDLREQQLINGFHNFGITKQLRGSKKKAFVHTTDGKKLHNSHLHSGIIASGKIKIIKEQ
ncbi:hypothetical protein QFZ37_003153 [Chryseobacterium ginsenosidimutans]|uniref:hypothetical protein n=1 Tax=Chryseobacterium ginsenosidimutans TaxID=687846 RepID=UPI00277E7DB4|nr:hypothetical protein [Chryseobacterium ginsenosidimutans]MDQ0594784.1 hypothetical protein [Chryseobacterium ginsenosidimutans]